MVFSKEKIEELETRVKSNPGSPAFARLADYHRSLGHVDNAITLCEKGVKENMDYPTGHLLLGRCYYEKERVDEAVTEFETVLKLDRKNIFALKIMGDISAQKGQNVKAAQYYKKAMDYDPMNTAVQDMFRRFERYYKEPSVVVKEKPKTPQSDSTAQVENRIMDEVITKGGDSLSFDDLEKAVEETPSTKALAPDSTKSAPIPFKPDVETPIQVEKEVAPQDDLISLEEEIGLDPQPKKESPQEITEEEAIRTAEEIQGNLPETEGEAIQAAEEVDGDSPAIEEEAIHAAEAMQGDLPASYAETIPVVEDIDQVEPTKPTIPVVTEMVDLPPEMAGGIREERVGDFRARKSVVDRLIEEQTGLLETVSTENIKPKKKKEKEKVSTKIDSVPEIKKQEPPPIVETIEKPLESEPEMVGGYYNISGDTTTEDPAESSMLEGIDDVEITETIDENVIESVPVEEKSQECIEEMLNPETIEPSEAIPGVKESAVASVRAVKEAPVKETNADDELKALMNEIDADDSLKNFVSSTSETKAKTPEPVPSVSTSGIQEAKLPENKFSNQTPEILEETMTTIHEEEEEEEEDQIEPSNDNNGFYSLTGSVAGTEGDEALTGLNNVEMEGVLEEEKQTEVEENKTEETKAPEPVAIESVDVEPGTGVEINSIDIQEVQDVKQPEPTPEKAQKPDNESSESTPKPRKKSEKNKTKSITKVVSNVATTSLAEIYLRQGHKEQALAVYKKILEQSPDNKRIQSKIDKLEKEIETME